MYISSSEVLKRNTLSSPSSPACIPEKAGKQMENIQFSFQLRSSSRCKL